MWEVLENVEKTCSESAGRGEAEERGSEAGRGSRESGPKSRHSMWEVLKKTLKNMQRERW